MKNLFIGIDFSKEKFDVSLVHGTNGGKGTHQCFENNKQGGLELIKWVKANTKLPSDQWLFCGENSGLYSVVLCDFLTRKHLFMWLENPLQIKQSNGIKRDKNDKMDSMDIALYAYRFQDKARCWKMPEKELKALELLMAFRERLLKNKHLLTVSAKEIRNVLQRDTTARYIFEQSQRDIDRIKKEIKNVEEKMIGLIQENEALKETYELITSIKGVAFVNAVAILVATQNFTRFLNSRQFACYAGLAPFGKQSGSVLHTTPHVSNLANKKIKCLLTQAARCAVKHDILMRAYYDRKCAQGKNKILVINNVRNKIIHCMFALVRNKQRYQPEYNTPVNRVA